MNYSTPVLTPPADPSPYSLATLQQLLNHGPGTPRPRPKGGWRTKRCVEHGLRCDAEKWLCELCHPSTEEECRAQLRCVTSDCSRGSKDTRKKIPECDRRAWRDIALRLIQEHGIASERKLAEAATAVLGKSITHSAAHSMVRKLRMLGIMSGWKVVEK